MKGCGYNDCFTCPYPDCINDYVEPTRKLSPEQIKKISSRKSELRKEREKVGVCTQCGKRPSRQGYKMCYDCQRKFRLYKELENRKKGVQSKILLDGISLCAKCGKKPPQKPYKLCSRCLENNLKFLEKTPTHNGKKQKGGFTEANETFWRGYTNKKQKTS